MRESPAPLVDLPAAHPNLPFSALIPGWMTQTESPLLRRGYLPRARFSIALKRHSPSNFEDLLMIRLHVGNLSSDMNEKDFAALFQEYGRVFNCELTRDIFTGRCRGFGFVEMEGHEARAAIQGLNGKTVMGNHLRVSEEKPRGKGPRGRR